MKRYGTGIGNNEMVLHFNGTVISTLLQHLIHFVVCSHVYDSRHTLINVTSVVSIFECF